MMCKALIKTTTLLLILVSLCVFADKEITDIEFNDGATPLSVQSGSSFDVTITVTAVGTFDDLGNDLRKFSYTIDGDARQCIDVPSSNDIPTGTSVIKTITVDVPAEKASGTYDITFIAHRNSTCIDRNHDSPDFVVSDAITVTSVPTDILLDANSVFLPASIGDLVGNLTTTNGTPTYSYALSASCAVGEDADNGSFAIANTDELQVNSSLVEGNYSICITTTDSTNQTFSKAFQVGVYASNNAPTAITPTSFTAYTGNEVGDIVATFSATDVDSEQEHQFSLVNNNQAAACGNGPNDNALFQFGTDQKSLEVSSSLRVGTYQLCVQVSDGLDTFTDKVDVTVEQADSGKVITAVTLNGGSTGISVNAGDTIAATMTVEGIGAFDSFGSDWRNTAYTIEGQSRVCVDTPAPDNNDIGNNNTQNSFTESFTIDVPPSLGEGTYDITFFATRNTGCNPQSHDSPDFVFSSAITVEAPNTAPTDIILDNTSISAANTGTGATVGNLSATDADDNSHTFSILDPASSVNCFVSGNDNSNFQISGNVLQTASSLTAGNYQVCVQANDGANNYDKELSVEVTSSPNSSGQCDAVFSTGVSSHAAGGRLIINSDARIINTPTTVLDFELEGNVANNSCVSGTCSASGSASEPFELPTYPSFSGGSNVSRSSATILGEGSYNDDTFSNVEQNDNSLTFSSNYTTYYLNQLNLNNGSVANFPPGTYYIKTININDGRINVTGNGTVNIIVQNNFQINNDSFVNGVNDNAYLNLVVYNNANFNSDSRLEGSVYVNNQLSMNSDSRITGAVAVGNLTMNSDSRITYDSSVVSNIDYGDFCGGISISLSPNAIQQSSTGVNVEVGTLTADGTSSPIFQLIDYNEVTDSGTCTSSEDDNNGLFNISNNKLRVNGSTNGGTYSVCVKVTEGSTTHKEPLEIRVLGLLAWYPFEDPNPFDDATSNTNNGTSIGGVTNVLPSSPISCKALSIPNNTTDTIQALNTGLDLDAEIGDEGTIAFWYNPNENWVIGSDRQLIDASTNVNDRYFFAALDDTGKIQFGLEDGADDDKVIETRSTISTSDEMDGWVHFAFVWSYPDDNMKIFVNGVEAETSNDSTVISDDGPPGLNHLYIGDNSSTYFTADSSNNSADGLIDEVHIYNYALSASQIQTVRDTVSDCTTTIHHYEISHDGAGLTCAAEPVTIIACEDANCDDKYEGDVTLTLSSIDGANNDLGSWQNGATQTQTFSASGFTFNLDVTSADTSVISISDLTPNADNATTCNQSPCEITFSDEGFLIKNDDATPADIGTQIAETNFGITIQAVQSDDNSSCVATLQNQEITLGFNQVCSDPNSCSGNNFVIDSNDSGTDPDTTVNTSGYNEIAVTFDSNGEALINSVYNDAGRIDLNVRWDRDDMDATNDVFGSSNEFVVKPAYLTIRALDDEDGSLINGSSSSASEVHIAGEEFYSDVTAYGSKGGVLANYSPGNLQLSAALALPSGGQTGSLSIGDAVSVSSLTAWSDVNFGAFSSGVGKVSDATFSEVGVLQVDVQDEDYLSTGVVSSSGSIDVGRFTPAYFDVSDNGTMSLTGTYTYLGQEVSFSTDTVITVTARNLSGGTTENYDTSGFFKMTEDSADIFDARSFVNQVSTPAVTISSSLTDYDSDDENFTLDKETEGDGIFTYTMLLTDYDSVLYDKTATVVDPFTVNLDFVLDATDLTDSDNVGYDTSPDIVLATDNEPYIISLTGPQIRYGRLNFIDSYGPETEALTLDFDIEYWDGSRWIVNTDDSASIYNSGVSSTADIQDPAITDSDSTGATIVSSGGDITVANGEPPTLLTTTIPGAGNSGEVRITFEVPIWLDFDWDVDGLISEDDDPDDDPFIDLTFGVYRGNDRIIYWQEVSN